jgi:hypothetical protein
VPPADPFEALNGAFLGIYDGAVAATLARTRPIVLVNRPKLVLFRDARREEMTVLPPLYNRLKAAAHVPLGLYTMLAPHGEGVIPPDRLARLRAFRDLAAAALADWDPGGLPAAQREPLEKLVAPSVAFMDRLLGDARWAMDELVAFLRGLRPQVDGSITAAVRLEIDAYHAQMVAWRGQMPPEEWRRLRVIVVEAPQARRAALGLEYFSRLLGEPREGGRILFAESLSLTEGEQWALDHVGKQELDTAVATAFFGDPRRLDRDILGDAALEYLNSLSLG